MEESATIGTGYSFAFRVLLHMKKEGTSLYERLVTLSTNMVPDACVPGPVDPQGTDLSEPLTAVLTAKWK